MIEVLRIDQDTPPLPIRDWGNVPVVVSSSNGYLPCLRVMLQSLLEQGAPTNFYDIILLRQEDYSPTGLGLLEELMGHWNNCSVRILDVRHETQTGVYTRGHVSAETYERLLVPKVMRHYTDVIYLDSDLIVCRDVAELLSPVKEDILLSAVVDLDVIGQYYGPEFSMHYYLNKKLCLKHPERYIQAGVLVFHIPTIRAAYGEETMMQVGMESSLRYFDQDVLNYLCEGKIQLLDVRWNVVADCGGFRIKEIIAHAPKTLYNSYLESRRDPWIVHFSGDQKPWGNPDMDMADIFFAVAKRVKPKLPQMPKNGAQIKRGAFSRFIARLLPRASRRRELCKTVFFSLKYGVKINRGG